jgi:hypothetical protein
MAYDYEGRVDFRGDPARALEFGRNVLVEKGLYVLPLCGNQMHFENAASYRTTNQDPLLMVSKGVVTTTGSALTIQAELGKLRSLLKVLASFMLAFVTPASAIMGILFVVKLHKPMGFFWFWLLFPAAMLAVLVPYIYAVQKRRGASALRGFLESMAAAAGKRP